MKIPSINEQGLLLHLDAGRRSSYPGSGATWRDLSGNGYHATLYGATYSPLNGGCMVFDGTDDYAVTATTSFTAGSNYTISLWYYVVSGKTSCPIMTNKDYYNTGQGINITTDISANSLVIQQKTSGELLQLSTLCGADGVWENLVATRSGTALNRYKNGALVGSPVTCSGTVMDAYSYFSIAKIPGAGAVYYNGRIGEIKVYQRALSQAEITQNYNATRGRFGL